MPPFVKVNFDLLKKKLVLLQWVRVTIIRDYIKERLNPSNQKMNTFTIIRDYIKKYYTLEIRKWTHSRSSKIT